MNKLKQALIKDFKNLYQKEYTGAWREARMIRSIEIGVMSLKNTEKYISSERQKLIEEVREIVKTTIGNDYHNIGMGSLDYHEKCAVDAFIKSFESRLLELNKLKGINEKHT